MPATALKTTRHSALDLQPPINSSSRTADHLFQALAGLHRLKNHDAALMARAAAGHRFIRAMHPFGENERALMRIALADLSLAESFVVEASAKCVADLWFDGDDGEWSSLCDEDRRRVLWFSAILRLAESVEAVCPAPVGDIHVAWSDEILHLELDAAALSNHDLERVLGRRAALEAVSGRLVMVTSSARRRGAA